MSDTRDTQRQRPACALAAALSGPISRSPSEARAAPSPPASPLLLRDDDDDALLPRATPLSCSKGGLAGTPALSLLCTKPAPGAETAAPAQSLAAGTPVLEPAPRGGWATAASGSDLPNSRNAVKSAELPGMPPIA